jgi:hypothetical protein
MTTAVSVKSEAQLGLLDTLVRDYRLNMTTAGTEITALQAGTAYYQVRGVCLANVANLAAFTVSQNGITYAAGDVVLLTNQTTAAQNGPYVVGTVSGTAPLTRPTWWSAAKVIPVGTVFEAGPEGTLLAGSSWKCTCAKGAVVGTDDPALYPRLVGGTVTLVAGTVALGASQGLFLLSTTKSPITLTRNTADTSTGTTGGYAAPVAGRTAGKIGTAAITIVAQAAAGTTNTADVSTLDWAARNW